MSIEKNMIDYLDSLEKEDLSIPIYEFDLEKDESRKYKKIMARKDFLKSQPKLGDFVPCNEKGGVMERLPDRWIDEHNFGHCLSREQWESEKKQYKSALDRVIWKGWEVGGYSDTSGNIATVWLEDGSDSSCDDLKASNIKRLKDRLSKTTYNELITAGVKLERIEKK